MIVEAGSIWESLRRTITMPATNKEESKAKKAYALRLSGPGRITIKTPMKPTIVTLQRLTPTVSRRNMSASKVVNNVRAKPMAVTSANGKWTKAVKPVAIAIAAKVLRIICKGKALVLNTVSYVWKIMGEIIISTQIWRIKRISKTGIRWPTCFIKAPIMAPKNEATSINDAPLTLWGNAIQ